MLCAIGPAAGARWQFIIENWADCCGTAALSASERGFMGIDWAITDESVVKLKQVLTHSPVLGNQDVLCSCGQPEKLCVT